MMAETGEKYTKTLRDILKEVEESGETEHRPAKS